MYSDLNQIYEKNLNKYYSKLDEEISKISLYDKKTIKEILLSIDNIFSMIQKTTKDYIIFLTLNEKEKIANLQEKIKICEKRMNEYKIKISTIKNKYEVVEVIPEYKKDKNKNDKSLDSFNSSNKMNNAIKITTDIERMSNNILVNLEEQTIGMKNTSTKILDINEDLDESKNDLNEMLLKQKEDKTIIVLIGGFLSFLLFVIFLTKIYNKFSN